jgi:hypothetical protein
MIRNVALDELRAQVEDEQRALQKHEAERCQERLDAIRDDWVKRLGQDVIDALQAEFTKQVAYFTYRDKRKTMENRVCSYKDTEIKLAAWMDEVDAWYVEREGKRDELVAKLQEVLGGDPFYDTWGQIQYAANDLGKKAGEWLYGDDEEIQELLGQALAKVEALQEKARRQAEEEQRRKQEAAQAQAEALLKALEQVQTWGELLQVELSAPARPYFDAYIEKLVIPYTNETLKRVYDAYEAARVRAREHREKTEAARQQAEREAFFPFLYYRVHYGIVAVDVDGDCYVDTRTVDVLHVPLIPILPFSRRWWSPADGSDEMQLLHVVRIDRVRVESVDQMPHWCPTWVTEFGAIRVPPEDAGRLGRNI